MILLDSGKNVNKKIFANNSLFGVSPEFKDLFEKMICPKPKERISLSQIKKHSWLQEVIGFYSENQKIKEKVEINKKIEKRKHYLFLWKKIKLNIYHIIQVLMKKKKIEQKEKAKTDNISNHSDDTNQKIRTKKSPKNSYSDIKNNNKQDIEMKNSLLKEFEIKYFKEFSSRKISIDKILKEQEDDVD